MKKTVIFTILGFFVLLNFPLSAQVSLPYYSGFDNAMQKLGWAEYKKAATTFSHWNYGGSGFSAPNCVGHDFSPSSGITLTDNWFVSPAFSIQNGGKLDSIRYLFSGFSTPEAGDTIGIYLLNGSPDPGLATSKQLLFDFRGDDYANDNTYHIKTNIDLPAYSGLCYIAIRYRNSDCSSKWLTAYFDNIAISGNGVGINESDAFASSVHVYPNPANGTIFVDSQEAISALEIYNIQGEKVYSELSSTQLIQQKIDLSACPSGIYFVKISIDKKAYVKKIVLD